MFNLSTDLSNDQWQIEIDRNPPYPLWYIVNRKDASYRYWEKSEPFRTQWAAEEAAKQRFKPENRV